MFFGIIVYGIADNISAFTSYAFVFLLSTYIGMISIL